MIESPPVAQRHELARIVARESAETLVGQPSGLRVEFVSRLMIPVARTIAGRFVDYDRMLGAGLSEGAGWIVQDATGGVDVEGREHVPQDRPVLVVANHPGLSDAVSLLAALGREDAWIVVAEYPFLRAMRLASRRFIFVPASGRMRVSAVRGILSRLGAGETVLLFPAGGLELDPALSLDGALSSLASWSRSIKLLARLARDALILPALVRGAISSSAYNHPVARRRHTLKERQRMASLLQLAMPSFRRGRVSITFGAPIRVTAGDVHASVLAAVRGLMTRT